MSRHNQVREPFQVKSMIDPSRFKGPGIAAVGFLTGAASASFVLCCYQIDHFTDTPRWIYLAMVLLGYAGVVAGFLICAIGVVVSWASIGLRDVNLAWLYPIAERILRWSPTIFFKCGAGCTLVGLLLTLLSFFSLEATLRMGGVLGLAAAACVYVGTLATLWKYLARQLLGDR